MPLNAALIHALLAAAGATSPAEDPQTAPAPGAQAPPSYPQWKGALAAGAVWTEGNTVTSSANVNFNAERRGEKDRWTFDGYWNWAQQGTDTSATVKEDNDDTEVTALNYGGGAKYDYFASKKLYYYGNTSAKVDPIADLNLRYILGAGAGYQIREDEKLKWGGEAGWSIISEDLHGTDNDTIGALRLASNLTWQISKTSAFDQVSEVFPSAGDTIARLDNRLKMNITAKWIAQLQYVLDFDNSPAKGAEQTDHRVVLGLGWSFGS